MKGTNMPITLSLEGQSAIVTGGASGIGRAAALLLAEAGARVTVFDINDKMSSAFESGAVKLQHCDMSDLSDISRAFNVFLDRESKVDILINNVGVWLPGGDILDMTDENITKMDAVNVIG